MSEYRKMSFEGTLEDIVVPLNMVISPFSFVPFCALAIFLLAFSSLVDWLTSSLPSISLATMCFSVSLRALVPGLL